MARDIHRGMFRWDLRHPPRESQTPFTHPETKLRDLRPELGPLPDAGFACPRWMAYALLLSLAVLVGSVALVIGWMLR